LNAQADVMFGGERPRAARYLWKRIALVALAAGICVQGIAADKRGPIVKSVEPVLEVASFGMVRSRSAPISPRDTVTDASTDPAAVAGGDLYLTAETIGLPDTMVDDIVNIFSGDLDFHRDLAQGFKCTVLFEMQFEDGRIVKSGRILALKLETPARTLAAYWFAAPGRGASGYYAADGKPKRSVFLQSPIVFSRVTSAYSVRRFHPILKTWRAHNGTDFAAPAGTPVRATADGVLGFAGNRGGYGKLITLRHANGMSSWYGHLQSFRADLKVGQHIRQGETIAAVGSSGLATGPHLHYELRRLEQPVNPVSVNGTPPRLAAAHLAKFRQAAAAYDNKLAAAYRTHFIQR
jgi:murein DD-endopeptidase MepM/ murein hydrolase activator NlpD